MIYHVYLAYDRSFLLKVVFTWMEGKSSRNTVESYVDKLHLRCVDSSSSTVIHQMEKVNCACEFTRTGKRKYLESGHGVLETSGSHPINEILLWHNAIKRELNEIAEEARKIQVSGDFTNLSAFNARLQFIAEVCIFHRYSLIVLSCRYLISFFLNYLMYWRTFFCLLQYLCPYIISEVVWLVACWRSQKVGWCKVEIW